MLSMSCCIFIAFVYDIMLVLSLSVEFTVNSVRHTVRHGSVGSSAADNWVCRTLKNRNPDFGFLAEMESETLVRGF